VAAEEEVEVVVAAAEVAVEEVAAEEEVAVAVAAAENSTRPRLPGIRP
jgi:hypothetical protein